MYQCLIQHPYQSARVESFMFQVSIVSEPLTWLWLDLGPININTIDTLIKSRVDNQTLSGCFMDSPGRFNFIADRVFIHFADLPPPSPIDSWVPHESNGAMHLPLTYHIIMWRIAWHIADHFTTKKSSNWTKNLANAAKPLVRVHRWPHDVPWPSKIILFVDLKGREQICTFCIFNSVIFMIFCGHIRGN